MATRGGSCRPLIDSLQSQASSLAYASDSGIRDAAHSAPTPSDSCAFLMPFILILFFCTPTGLQACQHMHMMPAVQP